MCDYCLPSTLSSGTAIVSERIAVVITHSDDYEPAAAMMAKLLGYKVIVPRSPSIHSVTRAVPDLIMFDWGPGTITLNTKLLEEIRASAVTRQLPVCVFHSSVDDVPPGVLTTDRVAVLGIPIELEIVRRALSRLGTDLVPEPAIRPSKPDIQRSPRSVRTIVRRKVFIGHGRSPVWKELRSFLTDRLELDCIDFNSDSTAGVPTTERLDQMLHEAAFAFVVLTAEDPHADGSLHARENAIHEIGLFQGRLGLKRAVVLLEEGCHEFTNIAGLGQIRFPKGGLLTKSEEIRQVLEREGLL